MHSPDIGIEPVCDQNSLGQGLACGSGVGRRQVDGHVGDPSPPRRWLSVQPRDSSSAAAALDLARRPPVPAASTNPVCHRSRTNLPAQF
jgi:hypothetical protein